MTKGIDGDKTEVEFTPAEFSPAKHTKTIGSVA
jgi:hypothetical protein